MPKTPYPPVTIPNVLTVSNSVIREWLRCRRAFLFNYLMLLSPLKLSVPLWIGTYIHNGLEAFYRRENPEDFVSRIGKEMDRDRRKMGFLTPEDEVEMDHSIGIVEGMLLAYSQYYHSDLKRWKMVEPEMEFQIKIHAKTSFIGKIDAILESVKEKPGPGKWIMEHKTTSHIDKGYVDRLPIDRQITGYAVGVRELIGLPPKGIIYNIIKKPSIRPRVNESSNAFSIRLREDYLARPEFYFYREYLTRNTASVDEWKEEISEIVYDIEETIRFLKENGLEDSLSQFYRNTDACTAPGRECVYLPICTKGWLDDTIRTLYRIRENFNPEFEEKGKK